MDIVRDYIEALWGAASNWPAQKHYKRFRKIEGLQAKLPAAKERMPTPAQKRQIIGRDGYNCRFCGVPVIPATVRAAVNRDYPELGIWGPTNASQHAGFQALWLQYDHVVPASHGGTSDPYNVVITCAGCNYCKSLHHLDELGLEDPRARKPIHTSWDGLCRYINSDVLSI